MGILTDVIDELRAELHQVPADVTDEQRVWALMALQVRAEEGDEDARGPAKGRGGAFRPVESA
jgi:hypothetical protein